jgi:aminoglycoside phosphotransferase (APT) family kinase protein
MSGTFRTCPCQRRPQGAEHSEHGRGGADLQIYCKVTGGTVPDLNWYFAYNLFRLAGITQGIAGRIRDGTAANAKAMESARRTVPLSKDAWAYAQKAGAK